MMMKHEVPKTLIEAIRHFANPDICREFVAELRWPDGVTCPREGCGCTNVHFIATRKIWRCNGCKKQFSVKVGTILEDSPIGLETWLPAIWLITTDKKGVSSYQLARALDVTQKTAWFMLHRIRLAMKSESFNAPLSGEVEADETYVGGKERNKHASRRYHLGTGGIGKAAVMGLLQRHGEVRAKTIPNNRKRTVQTQVHQNVVLGSTVYDALASYTGLEAAYVHEVIDHAEAYVRGQIHTNGLENFWSLFKRTIYGRYHSVEPFHLDRYLDEATQRFNTRNIDDGERFAIILRQIAGRRLTYEELIGKTES